ncbi:MULTISPECIES: DNA-directed RNA polymerase subunit beta [Bacillaceae]|uniref:DNA-directed RNA polymerase subunit beta n=1 Tax=Oceanobacillus caeni TaxID=405946 RepID=A0ABR5MK65_9BACI|nr:MULTISPECIES: DNA-directed RNA polymerase subunit beta [Bacillaceae]KKE80437.1 hypothetical protein WH51_01890 [Bacilli bacterium VT-13-104]PZD83361.1 DNA-directed RNA polymerase subunit beta [Bacilli bacterium]KPH76162.1 hypothetical protein AFL42_06715 [Oceanobacillus caeni]MBU8789942.1 DNA-directed RNA polymerase subunit beta [Oceanobacillus caeni]MED4475412.1 DNA-directed RNA polymerase subunit beta [Oceanobacillus caeni]
MSTEQLEKVAENPTRKEQKEKTAEKQPKKNHAETRKQLKEQKKKDRFQKLGRLLKTERLPKLKHFLKFERRGRRMFPIWLRIIVVLSLAAIALVVGLMVGYGVLGNGNLIDALKIETWQHLIDIVVKAE